MLRCRRLQEIAQEFSGSGQGTCTKLRDQTNKFDDRGTNPFPVPLNTSQEIMLYWPIINNVVGGGDGIGGYKNQSTVTCANFRFALQIKRFKKNMHEADNAKRPKTTTP
jgi:hypothetical protein